jgi:hypothetical protein
MITRQNEERVAKAVAFLGDEVLEDIQLVAKRIKTLSEEEEIDYLVECARFVSHQYLRDLKPGGYAARLAEQLLTQVDSDLIERRGRSASNLMSLAILSRPSIEDGAFCTYEQIKLFNVWYENHIENRKEE